MLSIAIVLGGCATLVNDPMMPMTLSFSDSSEGECSLENKRGYWVAKMPSVVHIRRSDDALKLVCKTLDGRSVAARIPPLGFSLPSFLLSDGAVDSITDMDREYPDSYVVSITPYK